MYIFEGIPRRAQDILATSENAVRSLTCNDLEFSALKPAPSTPPGLAPRCPFSPSTQLSKKKVWVPKTAPKRAPWLLGGMILMGLDSYFLTICCVLSMDAPLRGHTSLALDGVLVDPFPRMGAKLSLAPSLTVRGIRTCDGLKARLKQML
ncbi:hypothetical protein DSO57_1019567 [Entomophthora muscae]|uniref:Uncharacterized protein n=1 Tax=Entomophthora muscae TaxID=34485 RepID=A0ACC2RV53_9FUNG|nr:hypothetical protein DSO57_1019567 [Entomophthora muscae]